MEIDKTLKHGDKVMFVDDGSVRKDVIGTIATIIGGYDYGSQHYKVKSNVGMFDRFSGIKDRFVRIL